MKIASMSQQNRLLSHLKMFVLETFTAAAFPGPSEVLLAQGWGAALSRWPQRRGWDGAHGSPRCLRCSDARRGHGRVDGALHLACSSDSWGAALQKPGVVAYSRCLAWTTLTPSLVRVNGTALAVRAVGDRGSQQWDFVFWLWLELR